MKNRLKSPLLSLGLLVFATSASAASTFLIAGKPGETLVPNGYGLSPWENVEFLDDEFNLGAGGGHGGGGGGGHGGGGGGAGGGGERPQNSAAPSEFTTPWDPNAWTQNPPPNLEHPGNGPADHPSHGEGTPPPFFGGLDLPNFPSLPPVWPRGDDGSQFGPVESLIPPAVISAVPEPATYGMIATGILFAGVVYTRTRHRKPRGSV